MSFGAAREAALARGESRGRLASDAMGIVASGRARLSHHLRVCSNKAARPSDWLLLIWRPAAYGAT